MTTRDITADNRRQLARQLLNAMDDQTHEGQLATLRQLADECLGFAPVSGEEFPVNITGTALPPDGHVIARPRNPANPQVTVASFNLSGAPLLSRRPIDHATAQAASAAVQSHHDAAIVHPATMLIFILADGIQFIYGEPTPGTPTKLMSLSRITYRWGDHNRTTVDALAAIGHEIADGMLERDALHHGFSVQPVTDQFFRHYKSAYRAAATSLQPQLGQDQAEIAAQTLLNRLLFVHFISKKGWLTFNSNRDYLNALWQDYQANPAQNNFHTHRLSPLFHEGLSRPVANRPPGIEANVGHTPYLNSGLFKRNTLDEVEAGVDDKVIAQLLGPDGLFNRYNFTVSEATPLDTEVAVDPEMLGKLFEETVNERHSSGAYYTPRPVVSFMCREALKGYLSGQHIPDMDESKIANLVDHGSAGQIAKDTAAAIAQALREDTILDPACGSGAFLLGMMQTIIAVNDSLFHARPTPQHRYRQKQDIISRNLYGTDKDETAVRTAMLRLWLSMAVDYEGDDPPTLPNLELKLSVGDALSGPNPENSQGDFMYHEVQNSGLAELTEHYTGASDPVEQLHLNDLISTAKASIREAYLERVPDEAIDWRSDFATINQAGGFDIVVANPPYVRQGDIKPDAYKKDLNQTHSAATTPGSDLYCYFYARALELLRAGGMHVFVCSNRWLDVTYGTKLQAYLLDHATIEAIYESAIERQFSTAIISLIRKGQPSVDHRTRFVQLRQPFEIATTASDDAAAAKKVVTKTAAELRAAGTTPASAKSTDGRGGNKRNGYAGDKCGASTCGRRKSTTTSSTSTPTS